MHLIRHPLPRLLLPWCLGIAACGDDTGAGSSTTGSSSSSGGATTDSTSAPMTTSGTTAVGSTSGDESSGGVDSTGDSSGDSGGPPPIEIGGACGMTERIGTVTLWSSGATIAVYGRVFDRPDPYIGPPERTTDTCVFHRFPSAACDACDPDQVCSFDGTCVAAPIAFVDASLDVTIAGDATTFDADPITGEFYGELTATDEPAVLRLRFGDHDLELPAMTTAAAVDALSVVGTGDASAPTSLTAAWTPREDDTRVRTVIAINHHAAAPTFTICDAPASTGSFTADAEMLQPLAVVTGLEFQGVDVATTAALHTELGCIDVRMGVAGLAPIIDWSP